MFEAQYAFGPATRLQAQAIGEPGHRTFRLLVESDDGRAAALWVEKEQLQALGLAIEQLLAEFQGVPAARAAAPAADRDLPAQSDGRLQGRVDWRSGRTRASSRAARATCCWCTTWKAAAEEEEPDVARDLRHARHARAVARVESQHHRSRRRRPPALPALRRADGRRKTPRLRAQQRPPYIEQFSPSTSCAHARLVFVSHALAGRLRAAEGPAPSTPAPVARTRHGENGVVSSLPLWR